MNPQRSSSQYWLILYTLAIGLVLAGCTSNGLTLKSLIFDDKCINPCFWDMEVRRSTKDDLIAILQYRQIEYQVTDSFGQQYFRFQADTPLSLEDESERLRISVMLDNDGILTSILLNPVNLCVDTVIREFGDESYVFSDDNSYQLIYISGFQFNIEKANPSHIRSISMQGPISLRDLEITGEAWNTVSDLFNGECIDNFAE